MTRTPCRPARDSFVRSAATASLDDANPLAANYLRNAVETIVDTYVGLRKDESEDFLTAYRRVGMAPFKAALYEKNTGADI